MEDSKQPNPPADTTHDAATQTRDDEATSSETLSNIEENTKLTGGASSGGSDSGSSGGGGSLEGSSPSPTTESGIGSDGDPM